MAETRMIPLFAVVLLSAFPIAEANDGPPACRDWNARLQLWYTSPAEVWDEAMPVGNGRLGAMVFGGVHSERIQLNEESLWAGTRLNANNPRALEFLGEIRSLLLAGKNDEALPLAERYLVGTPPSIRSFQTLGDIFLTFDFGDGEVLDYRRDLNLQTGIASVSFATDRGSFHREIFASAPDDVIVMHFDAAGDATFTAGIVLRRQRDAVTSALADRSLEMTGQIIDEPTDHQGPGGAHMRFAAHAQARHAGGHLEAASDSLIARDVHELTLVFSAATDYNLDLLNFDLRIDPVHESRARIERVSGAAYDELKRRHIEDHQALFDRFCVGIGFDEPDDIPTDLRLQRVIDGGEDPFLAELYLQFGRYLLMGSSRTPGRLPANLQGIWNEHFNAPWNSDYHVNINLQMNYWPAEVLNVPETKRPLIELFDRIREPGRVTAAEMYGAGGWTMHHLTDIFGRTALMDEIRWGTFPLGGAWMSLQLWEHFEFGRDRDFLAERIYPVMRESAEFVLDFLIEDERGRLVTAPSYSPENSFGHPGSGLEMRLTYGPTMDVQIITELFNACVRAGTIVGDDPAFLGRLEDTLARLPPVKVGRDGTVQEWIGDYEEVEPGHRHMSHLFGLHPGTQISTETPELFRAARNTIEKRLAHGGAHTGWSRAWIINLYARLLDGEAAYAHLLELFRQSTLKNLFDTHPPFQIDGNFGGAAGIAEMLVQSHNGEIHALPALPAGWGSGFVHGLTARGGFDVHMTWEDHELTEVTVTSTAGMPLGIRYGDRLVVLKTESGRTYRFDGKLKPQ